MGFLFCDRNVRNVKSDRIILKIVGWAMSTTLKSDGKQIFHIAHLTIPKLSQIQIRQWI
ncbi:hypothetical protein IQ244_27180 [Nostoc sp. LEGE 06077]|nr:hypothetical protein [Nostoc sp. LEGE 06077]